MMSRMKETYRKGVVTHSDPESCTASRDAGGEAQTGTDIRDRYLSRNRRSCPPLLSTKPLVNPTLLIWATCPITVNGCIRIISNPRYPTSVAMPTEIAGILRSALSRPDHHFWEDSVSLLDESLFQPSRITGHRNITDVYLPGLAVRNHGRLATFDRSIPMKAVHGAGPRNLIVIGRV